MIDAGLEPPRWLTTLLPHLETACAVGGVPLGVAVGWITVESGGNLAAVTKYDERGLFQLMPAESAELGLDHERLSTDLDYSIEGGLALARHHDHAVGRALAALHAPNAAPEGTEYRWRLAKLSHSMGPGALHLVLREAGAPGSWDELGAYCGPHELDLLHLTGHSPGKWLGLVERVFSVGRPYGVGLPWPDDGAAES